MKNITLVCQIEECTYRDGDVIHDSDVSVKYPDSIEEAAREICTMRRWAATCGHRCDGWQITVLLNGREPDSDAEIELADEIERQASVLVAEAEQRWHVEEEAKKEAERQHQERLAALATQRQAEADRAKFAELKAKYGWL